MIYPAVRMLNFTPITLVFLMWLLMSQKPLHGQEPVQTGADRMEQYLPLLRDQKVALVVNQTAEIDGVLLPDTLLHRGVSVTKIFAPEHGFRGVADAGASVADGVDKVTGLPVISLYGKHKQPTGADLQNIDIVIYDIQDVGARFYTYISTLEYLMTACAAHDVPLLILDRPNPLGFIVDGPVLEPKYRSFVGRQPIPVLYGMTPGEYAKMLVGEKWFEGAEKLKLTIIPCANYTHRSKYELPVAPSPNLKSMTAIYLYPSLCFFEGTVISVGRGTATPFQLFGHPKLKNQPDGFTPESMLGASNPPLKGQYCHGTLIATTPEEALQAIDGQLTLKWLLSAYRNFPDKKAFFNNFFNTLAGTGRLKQQIIDGLSESDIRQSWQADLDKFRKIRNKYLLYPE